MTGDNRVLEKSGIKVICKYFLVDTCRDAFFYVSVFLRNKKRKYPNHKIVKGSISIITSNKSLITPTELPYLITVGYYTLHIKDVEV